MNRESIIQAIEESVLPADLKKDSIQATESGDIVSGEDALQSGMVPKKIVAGSFDPATFGHKWLIQRALESDPDAGILIVSSTGKSQEYQLFHTAVRAALLRSYGIKMRMILVGQDDSRDRQKLLSQLHQSAETIVKGRRTRLDSEHTDSLSGKYQLKNGHFEEVQCPDDLIQVSSGDVKGLLTLFLQDNQLPDHDVHKLRQSVSDVVAKCTLSAIQQRSTQQNAIYLDRLRAGSSEALFAQA